MSFSVRPLALISVSKEKGTCTETKATASTSTPTSENFTSNKNHITTNEDKLSNNLGNVEGDITMIDEVNSSIFKSSQKRIIAIIGHTWMVDSKSRSYAP